MTIIALLAFCPLNLSAINLIEFSHESGTYSNDIEFTVSHLTDKQKLLLCFIDSKGEKGPWVYFDGKMNLTAVPNETRSYRFKIQLIEDFKSLLQRDFSIIIQKSMASVPQADLESGEYPTTQKVTLKVPENNSAFYILSGAIKTEETLWEGEAIQLPGSKNQSLEYKLEIYCKNASGDKSASVFYNYTITEKEDYEPRLRLLSPVAGTYANEQWLVIDNRNFQLVTYTTDGRDPKIYGELYLSPVILSQSGALTLKVWALPRWTGYVEQEISVDYNVTKSQDDFSLSPKEDTYFTDLELTLKGVGENPKYYYTLDDSSPGSESSSTSGIISLQNIQNNGPGYLPLRIRQFKENSELGPEYRFSYIIKEQPFLDIKYRFNESGYRILFANIPEDYRVYYSLDGRFPDVSGKLYSKSITISKESASDNKVKLRAGLWNSSDSLIDEALWLFPFSENLEKADQELIETAETSEPKEKPLELSVEMPENTGSSTMIKIPRTENTLYEIASGDLIPEDPDIQSAALNEDLLLTIPFGMELKFNIKLAAYDPKSSQIFPPKLFHYTIDKKPPENPVISGYKDLRLSNQSLELAFQENSGKIYYKITKDGSVPQLDASNTILYSKPITLTGVAEKNTEYRLIALAADEYGNISPSLIDYRFQIDRSPPLPPSEPFISPFGNSVEQRFQILWHNTAGDKIYYRIVDDLSEKSHFQLYTEPLFLDITQNPRQLHLEYYKENSLGNQSAVQTKDFSAVIKTQEPSYRYFIDSPIIYVAPSAGSKNVGTKDHPFTSLETACEYAQNNRIKTIFMAQGDYILNKEIVVKNQLEIFGGFDPITWNRNSDGQTTIAGASDFPLHRYYFNLQDASLYLTALNVENTLQRVSSLINGRGSYVRINDSQFRFSGIDQRAISVVGGKCEIVNSTIISDDVTFGSFIYCERSSLNISGSSLLGKGVSDTFKAIVIKDSPEAVLRFVTLSPGKARESIALEVVSSRLLISQSKIESGLGSLQATALSIQKAQLELNQSVIKTHSEAPYALGISSFSSIVNLHDVLFEISAKAGATALALAKGESVISNSRFKGGKSSDYLYHIHLKGGSHQMYNNVFWSGTTSGSIAVVISKSHVNIFNNTFIADNGPRVNEAINILPGSEYYIINNIFSSQSLAKGSAIHLVGEQSDLYSIQNNCFSNWLNLLVADFFIESVSTYGEMNRKTTLSSISELNGWDNEISGGMIDSNITDDFNRIYKITKQQEFHLSSFSFCINQGQALGHYNIPQLNFDIDGEPRPSSVEAQKRVDIGADEFYP